jgi:hypothetical protein
VVFSSFRGFRATPPGVFSRAEASRLTRDTEITQVSWRMAAAALEPVR